MSKSHVSALKRPQRVSAMPHDAERLPCRGCTRDCENYDRCGGRPWTVGEQLAQSLAWSGLRTAENSARKAGDSAAT